MKPEFTKPEANADWTYIRQGLVVNIVDGDTVDLDISLGFRVRMQMRFRLYGINTPERGQPNYNEAKDFLASLIPPNTFVDIRSYKPNVLPKGDSFGRWVIEIFKDGVNINEAMVESGLAKPYMRDR